MLLPLSGASDLFRATINPSTKGVSHALQKDHRRPSPNRACRIRLRLSVRCNTCSIECTVGPDMEHQAVLWSLSMGIELFFFWLLVGGGLTFMIGMGA